MERGQASLEYVGVVALVAIVLAAAAALVRGPDLAGAVAGQVRRALCLVAGGDCLAAGAAQPCVTGSLEHRRDLRAQVAVLRLGDGRVVLREERSDGTVAVTVVQSGSAGAGLVFGADLPVGGRTIGASGEVAADAVAAHGRTFVRPDRASADRLVADLQERDVPVGGVTVELLRRVVGGEERGPRADQHLVELGTAISGEAGLGAVGLSAVADALAGSAAGVRVHTRTGEREVVLRLRGELAGRLTAPFARAGFGLPSEATATIAFDRAGRPLRLTVGQTRTVHGGVRVGEHASQGGDRLAAEVRLELDDEAARADLLAALRGLPGPAVRTARRLAERGRTDVRLYATTRDERRLGTTVGLGPGVGGELVRTTERARLVAAFGHEPGLGWSRNLDCEAAAR
jgi:hypothetical protein